MKKRIVILTTVLLMTVAPMFGQVIITGNDVNHNREGSDVSGFGVMVPMEGSDVDQWKYSPLDGGMLLLAGLGAAYLLGKRKKS